MLLAVTGGERGVSAWDIVSLVGRLRRFGGLFGFCWGFGGERGGETGANRFGIVGLVDVGDTGFDT